MKFLKYFFLVAPVLFFATSCQKDDAPAPEAVADEPAPTDIVIDEPVYPSLHMHFDADVPKEEQDKLWAEAIADFEAKQPQARGLGRVHFTIETTTGYIYNNGRDEGTDASVRANVKFYTEVASGPATLWYNNLVLDRPNFNDREMGTDKYYFSKNLSQIVYWLRWRQLKIKLKGTDDWYVTKVWGHSLPIYPYAQGTATGGTNIHIDEPFWLQASSSTTWASKTVGLNNYAGDYNKIIFP